MEPEVKTELSAAKEEVKAEAKEVKEEAPVPKEAVEASSSDGEVENQRLRKTLRLNSERLKRMNLRPGSNEVQFSVTTAFQGTTRCK